jgi:Fic family protein
MRKGDYYDRLQFVRERGEIDEWFDFFLSGVAAQASDAVYRAELLADLREQYRGRLKGIRSRAAEVVDLLFGNPIITVRFVGSQLEMSQPGTANLLKTLVDHGIVRETGEGAGVRRRYFADDILRVLDPQTSP